MNFSELEIIEFQSMLSMVICAEMQRLRREKFIEDYELKDVYEIVERRVKDATVTYFLYGGVLIYEHTNKRATFLTSNYRVDITGVKDIKKLKESLETISSLVLDIIEGEQQRDDEMEVI